MNTKLTKFDKLMLAITFAEADALEECGGECGAVGREGRTAKGGRAVRTPRHNTPVAGNTLKAGC